MAQVPEWYSEFVAAVVARLPRDIDEATAMQWLQSPRALEDALRQGLMGAASAPAAAGAALTGPLKHDKTADGWQLIEDATEPTGISGSDIEAGPFPQEEDFLLGDEMVESVQGMGPRLGQRHAEYFLEHSQEIPEEYKRVALVFPGTIWRGTDSNHHVPYLAFSQGEWSLKFGILEAGVDSSDYMVRLRE